MTDIENLFDQGLEKRKSTLGSEYVERNFAAADDFTRPFQEAMTAWCWGFDWGDETINAKTRSMINLAMFGALGKMHERETHCRGALNNGPSWDEIRAGHPHRQHLLRCTAGTGVFPDGKESAGRGLIARDTPTPKVRFSQFGPSNLNSREARGRRKTDNESERY